MRLNLAIYKSKKSTYNPKAAWLFVLNNFIWNLNVWSYCNILQALFTLLLLIQNMSRRIAFFKNYRCIRIYNTNFKTCLTRIFTIYSKDPTMIYFRFTFINIATSLKWYYVRMRICQLKGYCQISGTQGKDSILTYF